MKNKKRGFTLVEIMVVVVIIGLISALVGPRLVGQSESARITTTRTQISNFEQALQLFHLNNGFFPTTEQGLNALISKPNMPPEPKNYQAGGYLKARSVPKDPWGNDYIYLSPGDKSEFDIISYGPAGRGGRGEEASIITNLD